MNEINVLIEMIKKRIGCRKAESCLPLLTLQSAQETRFTAVDKNAVHYIHQLNSGNSVEIAEVFGYLDSGIQRDSNMVPLPSELSHTAAAASPHVSSQYLNDKSENSAIFI